MAGFFVVGDTRLELENLTGLSGNDLGDSLESRGVKSGALSGDSRILAHADPELVTLCRLWPSLAPDLRERIKGMIVEAVAGGRIVASPTVNS